MPTSNDHNTHDPALIAAHAAGDLAGPALIRADRLLASCAECSRLDADLIAIARATRALPERAHAPRDYRLAADQAERLRRGGLLRRLLRPLASPSWSLRPLATTFSGLGAIGLAVVLLLPLLGGTAASLSGERGSTTAVDAGATAAPAPAAGEAAGSSPGGFDNLGPNAATAGPDEGAADQDKANDDAQGGAQGSAAPPAAPSAAPDSGTVSPATDSRATDNPANPMDPATILFVASIALLAVGLALFALRTLARRVA
jgi:hypothetical protein